MPVKPIRCLIAVAVLAAGLTVGASAAGADGAATQSVSASGLIGLGGGLNAFQVDFSARKSADGKVSGQFHGSGRLTGLGVDIPLPVSLAGPVTCLSVKGDTAAFLYPLTAVTPTVLQPVLGGTSIEITVQRGANGGPAHIGFLGPIPTALVSTCDGTTPIFTLDGSATVDAG